MPVAPEPAVVTLVAAPRPMSGSCRLLVWVHGARPGRAIVGAPPRTCAWLPGQRAVAELDLRAHRPRTNPGGPDAARRWRRSGVPRAGSVRAGLIEPAGAPPRTLAARIERLRRAVGAAVDPITAEVADPGAPPGPRAGGVLRALVTGDRAGLRDDVRARFRAAGVAHLLAISGLHVGWVFVVTRACAAFALRRSRRRAVLRRAGVVSLSVAAMAATAYALLAGLAVPSLRALAVALAGVAALAGGRPGSGWNALAVALLVVLAVDPAHAFEPGLALSFAAVAGILLWAPAGGAARRALGASVAASLATAPLLASAGLPLPRFGVAANALAIPWFGFAVVPLALVSGTLGALVPSLGDALRPLAVAACELGLRAVEELSSADLLRGLDAPVARASLAGASAFAARVVWRCAADRKAGRAIALAGPPVALAALFVPVTAGTGPAELLFLDVGHGAATLVRGHRDVWVVDAGSRVAGWDAGERVVAPALRAEAVARVAVLVVSHADLDHAGGAASLVESLPVGEVWLPPGALTAHALPQLRRAAARRGVPLRRVGAGMRRRVEPWEVRVLWPPAGARIGDANAGSLVVRLDGPGGCALLPADIPARVERELLDAAADCELLSLAHHGSGSSSSPDWLARVAPEVAIASAGRRRAPLPHRDVRRRLDAADVTLWETRRWGALRVRLGGPTWVAPELVRGLDARR